MRPVRVVAREPLEQVTSLKVKLGLLVAVSVLVATVLATLGAGAVPAGLSIPVTVLLALGVTQLLAVGMTSPLRQMTEAARRMAAGDYDVRVQASSSDEVGELARAFNRMAEDLATVDRQRRELVASVSHELRTPLTALVAVLENLADGVTEPDHETIRVALGQAERLSALVTDLLDLSRVDAGVVPLERGAVDVGSLVGEAVTEAGNGPRHVTFDVQVEPGLTAYADPARLHQLLANLLDNAARHSPAGTSVQMLARRVGDTVRLEVADQGPGIEAEDRERVFERFGTLRDVTGDAVGGGTGLGLAIARWVTDLHGGRITLVDPEAAETGARFRVDLPDPHPSDPTPTPSTTRKETSMTTPATAPTATARPPQRVPVPSIVDDIFGSYWQDRGVPGRPAVLLGCLGLGIFAGVTLPFERPGLAATLVLVAAGVLVLTLSRHRRTPFTWACAALSLAFALLVTLRDAEWVIVLGLLTGALLTTTALTAGHRTAQMLLGAMAWPLSGLRGMPWLGRTTRALGSGTQTAAVIRTAVISLVAVLVFGLLFSTADAVFGEWVDVVVPDVSEDLVLRIFIAVAVAGTVLAAAYLALNPPAFGASDAELRRPSQHRFEWLAPVLLIDAVFVLFIAAQAAAFFGGEAYIRSVTGLTYADYVHQGFAQMTIATLLTLVVVWAAARKVRLDRATDRWWLRGSVGALCVLTLVVVASAVYRMDLYQDAYGFTRLRLLVDVFEGWLGLLVVGVLAAGVSLRARWLPRAALLSGAAALLGLAAINPDAWIARHNLERYEASGRVDWDYLQSLSADATPTLAALPEDEAACALYDAPRDRDGWAGWNLSRARAHDALSGVPVAPEAADPCLELRTSPD